jgi:hypothetical protein
LNSFPYVHALYAWWTLQEKAPHISYSSLLEPSDDLSTMAVQKNTEASDETEGYSQFSEGIEELASIFMVSNRRISFFHCFCLTALNAECDTSGLLTIVYSPKSKHLRTYQLYPSLSEDDGPWTVSKVCTSAIEADELNCPFCSTRCMHSCSHTLRS